jgi:pimeloyl-ACP methyl ester carboxylesterase
MNAEVRCERGDRPAVVCVHGAGGGGWEWGIWARVLGVRGFEVLAPDLAAAEAGLAATRLSDYRRQVLGWCAAAAPRPVLVGASLGGLLALAAAREAAARALVLVNPLPPRGLGAAARPCAAVVPWGSRRSLAGTRRAMPGADDAARLYAFRRWRDESGAVLDEACGGIAADAPPCAALVVAGERDDDVPASSSRRLAAELEADFELVAGAGHVDPLLGRVAARTAERVADWLLGRARTV